MKEFGTYVESKNKSCRACRAVISPDTLEGLVAEDYKKRYDHGEFFRFGKPLELICPYCHRPLQLDSMLEFKPLDSSLVAADSHVFGICGTGLWPVKISNTPRAGNPLYLVDALGREYFSVLWLPIVPAAMCWLERERFLVYNTVRRSLITDSGHPIALDVMGTTSWTSEDLNAAARWQWLRTSYLAACCVALLGAGLGLYAAWRWGLKDSRVLTAAGIAGAGLLNRCFCWFLRLTGYGE